MREGKSSRFFIKTSYNPILSEVKRGNHPYTLTLCHFWHEENQILMQTKLVPLFIILCIIAVMQCNAQTLAPGDTAATVNGEKITVADWISRMENLHAQDFIASSKPLQFKSLSGGQIALQALIVVKLVYQYASKTSLLPSEANIDADIENMQKQPAIAAALKSGQLTIAQLKEQVKYERTLYNIATINHSCTPDEVQAYYDKHPESWTIPESVKIAAVMTSNAQDANTAYQDLQKGADFASVAKKYSEDKATSVNGGLIGNAAISEPSLPPFIQDAVKSLQTGSYSPVVKQNVQGKDQYFIFEVLERNPKKIIPFDNIKTQVERIALLDKVGGTAAANTKIDAFRKTSTIVVNIPGYQNIMGTP
jgi:parvulin-like peptidyl-prolyl isomerase